jgi:hypothetical protein
VSGLEIERLALQAPWLEAEQGRELARRVGDGLATAGLPGGRSTDRIAVSVAGRAGESVDELGGRIVAAVLRELRTVS